MIDSVYIKMSRTATEIQEAWKPKLGDKIAYNGHLGYITRFVTKELFTNSSEKYGRYIGWKLWLPRIEDLIEIHRNQLKVRGDLKTYLQFASWFDDNVFDKLVEDEPILVPTHDLTIIWLVFVMETCYQKKWDNNKDEWVEL